MRVLVGCEYSGTVRDEFIKRGHDAMSCDLLPTESPGPHYQGNIFDILNDGWDMLLAFYSCTYLCNSGVRWLYEQEGRWAKMKAAARDFKRLWDCPIPLKSLENPIMHKHAKKIINVDYSQIIQPWQFGHGETKATCLWLDGLPPLKPTNIVNGRQGRIHKMPPSEDRGKLRSLTFQGIAEAMADQWGST